MKSLALLFIMVSPAFAQDIETTKVADNIYMLRGRGGNIGVSAGSDGVLIIDNQFEVMVDKIKAAVGEISDKEIKFVVNTHLHGDHTGGNRIFGEEGKTIVAHQNVRKRMSKEQVSQFWDRKTAAAPEEALPLITFDHFITFHFNDDIIQVMHFDRAHTDGDAVVYFENANVMHTGDVFVTNGFPFVDSDSGGSLKGFINVLDKILMLINEDTKVIPGHGEISTKKDVMAFRNMLVDISGKIVAEVKAGTTLSELIAANPLAAYEDEFGNGFIKSKVFLTLVYPEFSEKE